MKETASAPPKKRKVVQLKPCLESSKWSCRIKVYQETVRGKDGECIEDEDNRPGE